MKDFYMGEVYSEKWIIDSITHGELQDCDDYILWSVGSADALKLQLKKRLLYTIREVYKVYDLCESYSDKKELQTFWQMVSD